MRTASQLLEQTLSIAGADPRIRAVVLEGSRANPKAPSDPFQDLDLVYVVEGLEGFKADPGWIEPFGERMVMQLPDAFGEQPPVGRWAYLLQFSDGLRLDLTLVEAQAYNPNSLSLVLLDKDGRLHLPPPSEASYFPKPPTAQEFFECCNEFWWVAPYVAKGLWRGEWLYALHHLEVLRQQCFRMLEWQFGLRTGFAQNPGKHGQHWRTHLPQQWQALLASYTQAQTPQLWEALYGLCELFRQSGLEVAARFDFEYPHLDDQRVSAHLRHVHTLPQHAKSIY